MHSRQLSDLRGYSSLIYRALPATRAARFSLNSRRVVAQLFFLPSRPPAFSRPINTADGTGSGNIVRIWKMHSSRRSRWRTASGRGQTFETSVSERTSTASTKRGDGCWRRSSGVGGRKESSGKEGARGREWRRPTGRWNAERRLYRAARHVSFFLIIIFNPIHCMVQQFALTPTSEILQGSLSDESPRRR